jgi:hypothetical protein
VLDGSLAIAFNPHPRFDHIRKGGHARKGDLGFVVVDPGSGVASLQYAILVFLHECHGTR